MLVPQKEYKRIFYEVLSLSWMEFKRLFCGILSVPQNIVMDMNNVTSFLYSFFTIFFPDFVGTNWTHSIARSPHQNSCALAGGVDALWSAFRDYALSLISSSVKFGCRWDLKFQIYRYRLGIYIYIDTHTLQNKDKWPDQNEFIISKLLSSINKIDKHTRLLCTWSSKYSDRCLEACHDLVNLTNHISKVCGLTLGTASNFTHKFGRWIGFN